MRGISPVAEDLVASQERLRSMKLVIGSYRNKQNVQTRLKKVVQFAINYADGFRLFLLLL
jgi:hypothetical protein